MNINGGNLTHAEATELRTQVIKNIGNIIAQTSELLKLATAVSGNGDRGGGGGGGSGGGGNDLAAANQEQKQAVIGSMVGALSSAVQNASQINGPQGGSEIMEVLSNMTALANSLEVTFDAETTDRIIDTISTVLDVRGSAPPDAAMDKIDTIISTLVKHKSEETVSVRTDRVALTSTTSPSSSSSPPQGRKWLAAFSEGQSDGSAGVGTWEEEVANMTATDAAVALDEPVRVQFHVAEDEDETGDRGNGDAAAAEDAAVATTTTLVQYSGGRNPFWYARACP